MQPVGPGAPEPWTLGSSSYGVQVAAYFGLLYCHPHFITGGRSAAEALDTYCEHFQPGSSLAAPHAALAVWRLGRDHGVYAALPSPEAAAYPVTPAKRDPIAAMRQTAFAETGPQVLGMLRALG